MAGAVRPLLPHNLGTLGRIEDESGARSGHGREAKEGLGREAIGGEVRAVGGGNDLPKKGKAVLGGWHVWCLAETAEGGGWRSERGITGDADGMLFRRGLLVELGGGREGGNPVILIP